MDNGNIEKLVANMNLAEIFDGSEYEGNPERQKATMARCLSAAGLEVVPPDAK